MIVYYQSSVGNTARAKTNKKQKDGFNTMSFQVPSGYDGADTQENTEGSRYLDLDDEGTFDGVIQTGKWLSAKDAPMEGWLVEITEFLGVALDTFDKSKKVLEVNVVILSDKTLSDKQKRKVWTIKTNARKALMGMMNLNAQKLDDVKKFCKTCSGLRCYVRPEPTNDGKNKMFSVGPIPSFMIDGGGEEEKAF